ncbi:unnamed protein product [Urochloa humidicola]
MLRRPVRVRHADRPRLLIGLGSWRQHHHVPSPTAVEALRRPAMGRGTGSGAGQQPRSVNLKDVAVRHGGGAAGMNRGRRDWHAKQAASSGEGSGSGAAVGPGSVWCDGFGCDGCGCARTRKVSAASSVRAWRRLCGLRPFGGG